MNKEEKIWTERRPYTAMFLIQFLLVVITFLANGIALMIFYYFIIK